MKLKKNKKKHLRRKRFLQSSLLLLVAGSLYIQTHKPKVAEALMPIEQWSTGQITSGAISWDILGRSMILNDVQTNVTSVSKHDAAILYSKDESTRKYTSGHTYKQYQNGERVIEESLYVEMFGVNKFGWSNNAFRVTPANFDRNSTVLGRSLLDNLYREGYNNNTLDGLLAKTSHAWLNGILTLRTASWPTHSTMHKDRLWKTGSANYSLARQVHVTKKAANAGAWSAQVKKDINILFEKKVGLPIIDDTPPVITVTPNSADWSSSARTVSISAYDNGVGLKELRTRQKLNSDGWSAWSAYQTGSTKSIKLSTSGSYTIQVQATDRNGNSKTHTTGAIKVDVTAPTHAGATINGARYVNGNTHWFRPNDSFEIDLSGYDRDSTMRYTYLRLSNANNDNRSVYNWEATDTSNLNTWMLGNYTEITGGKRDYWGWTPRYKYYTKVKSNASGQTLDVQYYYTDRVGHTNGYHSTGKTIKVDGVAPVTTLTASNTTWTNTDKSVTLTMSDALSGLKDVRWRISQDDGGTWGVWTGREKAGASKTLNFNSNGRWRVQFQVRDNVDYNTNAEGRWFIDKSAPVLNLGGSPTSWTKEDVNLTWSLYDNGGSGFKNIKLPNGSFSTATSGTFAAGSNGTYSFTAYDNAGNSTTKSITVSHIDKVIPVHEKVLMHDFRYQDGNTYWYHEGDVARIAMQQADADSRIKFGYLRLYGDGNDNRASYNWVVNNNTVNEFQKTGGFTNILPGSAHFYNISAIYIFNARMNATAINKTFQVHSYAEDNAGNTVGYIDTGVRVRTDSTPPTISPSAAPAGWINTNPTVTLTFADGQSGIKTKQYAWSTSTTTPTTWTNYTAPVTQAVAGTWYLHARATDNTGRQTVQRYGPYRIDKTAPNGTISGNPTSWTKNSQTLTVAVSDTGGSGYYRTLLPNGAYSTSTAPTYDVSANGTYSFVIYDHAGNSRTVSAVVNRIDTTAPTGSVSGNPTAWTRNNITLTMNGADSQSGVAYILDHKGNRTNGATDTFVVSENGTYKFTVYDHAGNSSVINTTVTKIDKSIPDLKITQSPTNWTNGNVTLIAQATDTGGSGVAYILDHNGNRTNGATDTFVATANGTYAFTIYDNAGNSKVVNHTVSNIERVKPTGTVTQSPTVWTNGNVTLTASAADTGGSGVAYILDHNGNRTNGATDTFVATANGTYQFTIFDNAGNSQVITRVVTNIERTKPTATISQSPTNWTNGNVVLTLNASDTGGSGVYRVKDPAGNFTTGALDTYTVTQNGTYTFTVYDHAGNSTVVSHVVSNIDKTNPVGTVSGNPTAWTANNVTLTLKATDIGSGVDYILDHNGNKTLGSTDTFVVTTNGTYTFTIYDKVGNSTIVSTTVSKIDKAKPVVSAKRLQTLWSGKAIEIEVTASDAQSGLKDVTFVSGPGRNLIRNSNAFTMNNSDHGNSNLTKVMQDENGLPYHTVTPVKNGNIYWNNGMAFSAPRVSGKTYTLSFDVKTTQSQNWGFYFYTDTNRVISNVESTNGEWKRHTYTFTQTETKSNNILFGFHGLLAGKEISWRNLKLEEGAGTPWSYAPEDATMTSGKIKFSAATNGDYVFRATDNVGNAQDVTVTVTNIDHDSPTLTIQPSTTAWTNQDVTLTITMNDGAGSGINRIILPNGTVKRFVGTGVQTMDFTVRKNGTYTFVLEDNVGNTDTFLHTVTNIDKTPPSQSTIEVKVGN